MMAPPARSAAALGARTRCRRLSLLQREGRSGLAARLGNVSPGFQRKYLRWHIIYTGCAPEWTRSSWF
eukprot:scaffold34905_cov64-Phaeocystis_antarctica.AAC.2